MNTSLFEQSEAARGYDPYSLKDETETRLTALKEYVESLCYQHDCYGRSVIVGDLTKIQREILVILKSMA